MDTPGMLGQVRLEAAATYQADSGPINANEHPGTDPAVARARDSNDGRKNYWLTGRRGT